MKKPLNSENFEENIEENIEVKLFRDSLEDTNNIEIESSKPEKNSDPILIKDQDIKDSESPQKDSESPQKDSESTQKESETKQNPENPLQSPLSFNPSVQSTSPRILESQFLDEPTLSEKAQISNINKPVSSKEEYKERKNLHTLPPKNEIVDSSGRTVCAKCSVF